MLKIFFKYFLSLTFIFISLLNEVQAMEKKARNYPEIIAQMQAREQADKEKKEKKAREEEAQRMEAVIKKRQQDEEKRKHLRDAEELIDAGEDEDIEDNIKHLEEAVINNWAISNYSLKELMADAKFLVGEVNPESNARGAILSEAIAYYLGVGQGDIDPTVKCIKYANKHNPDVNKYYKILLSIKSVREDEIKLAAQRKEIEMDSAKNEGKREGTRRGIIIVAGSVAAVVATWYGLSYVFGDHPSVTEISNGSNVVVFQ